jgi:hypothetical protein
MCRDLQAPIASVERGEPAREDLEIARQTRATLAAS